MIDVRAWISDELYLRCVTIIILARYFIICCTKFPLVKNLNIGEKNKNKMVLNQTFSNTRNEGEKLKA